MEQFAPDRFGPDGVRNPAIAALLERTHVRVADDLTAKYPAAWPARLHLTLESGEVRSGGSDYPRGNPENPVCTAELQAKFRVLVAPRFGEETARRAIEIVHSLDTCADMAERLCPQIS